jgi:hypothetical protein
MGKAFVDSVTEDLKPVYEILKNPKPMVISESETKEFNNSKNCYACNVEFETTRVNERSGKEEKNNQM